MFPDQSLGLVITLARFGPNAMAYSKLRNVHIYLLTIYKSFSPKYSFDAQPDAIVKGNVLIFKSHAARRLCRNLGHYQFRAHFRGFSFR